jgi:hypothetical protein
LPELHSWPRPNFNRSDRRLSIDRQHLSRIRRRIDNDRRIFLRRFGQKIRASLRRRNERRLHHDRLLGEGRLVLVLQRFVRKETCSRSENVFGQKLDVGQPELERVDERRRVAELQVGDLHRVLQSNGLEPGSFDIWSDT